MTQGSGSCVLLIEDDIAHAELIRLSFDDQPGEINFNHIGDGRDAIKFFFEDDNSERKLGPESPDLVLLDLRMPGVDGFQVLESLKNSENHRHIPVVVLSTSDAQKDIEGAYVRSANGYVLKPAGFLEFQELAHDVSHYWLGWNHTVD